MNNFRQELDKSSNSQPLVKQEVQEKLDKLDNLDDFPKKLYKLFRQVIDGGSGRKTTG